MFRFPPSVAGRPALFMALGPLFMAPPTADAQEAAGGQPPSPTGPALDRYALHDPATEWALPARLTEISGLAFSLDGRLFGHDDELAIIYQLNYEDEALAKAWSFGERPARGDFEGIAVSRDRVWLVTSNGRLYEGPEGANDERVLYNTYGTGVGRDCEVEGLAYEPSDDSLLLLCKDARIVELADFIAIYRWSIEQRRIVGPRVRIRIRDLTPPGEDEGFRASGLERDPRTGNYILVSASDKRIAEVTRNGTVLRAEQWSGSEHRQPEGVAIGPDGSLFVADEGQRRRARLKRYAPLPAVP